MTVAMPFVEIKQPHKINWMYYGQHGPASLSPLKKVLFQVIFRVAKCQIFYTEQNLQTKFYPKKSAKTATIFALKLNKTNNMDTFWRTTVNYSTKFYIH